MDDDFARHKKALDNQTKIEEVLRLIKKLSIHTKNDMGDGKFSINIPKITLDDLEEIKKILEN